MQPARTSINIHPEAEFVLYGRNRWMSWVRVERPPGDRCLRDGQAGRKVVRAEG